ncbi:MAG: prepilin peptidase [Myxococcota bacterium]
MGGAAESLGGAAEVLLPWLAGVSFVLGLLIGSFLNVVIHRLPLGESIVSPGSRCPRCERAIRPWENVPVLSYVALRGRCRGCGVRISPRYPAIELLTGLLFLAIALEFGASVWTPVFMAFAAAVVAAGAIDVDHQIIPDEISLGGLAVGLVAVPLAAMADGAALADAVAHSFVGALVGGGTLWVVGFAHARVSVALGREFEHWPGEGESLPTPSSLDYWTWFPGLGFGDVKLLAMVGAFLGPLGVMTTIVMASVAGLALGLGWALVTRSFASPFGFAPAIAAGALLALLAPPALRLF